MGLQRDSQAIYEIRCDNCWRPAKFAFSKRVAVAQAKHEGFQRFHVLQPNSLDPEYVWICKRCGKRPGLVESLKADTPKPNPAMAAKPSTK